MCKVSILVPIYNVEKYLHQCLESVVNQTLKDIEIICINDGSTDNSLSIIKKFAEKDSRIKIIDKKNTGYGHSMNCGLKIAQGEYIGIVESDDFADLDMFETLYNTAKENKAEIVKSNYWRQVGNYKVFVNLFPQELCNKIIIPREDNYILFYKQIAIWSAIYKRDFLLKNSIYFNETPGASYQDVAFYFKTMICADKVYLIKDAFLHYRIDNPNSSVKSKQKVYCIYDEMEEIEKFFSIKKEFFTVCKYILGQFKFNNYLFNFKRIDESFRFNFFKRMIEEFEKDHSAGYLNKHYWQDNKWQELQLMLNNNNKFFYIQYKIIQNKDIYKYGIFSIIEKFKNIYIYGAGGTAFTLMLNLFKRNIKINGILVSTMKNNPKMLMDISVNTLENIDIDKENDLILIAIKENDQYDILYKLKMLNFRNVILITSNIYRALN